MVKKSIGILYDSISPNTGDIAIGIATQQQLSKRNIESTTINPYLTDCSVYKTTIIAGGELLREPGDDYYDNFRIEGNHILNAVGIRNVSSNDYLNDYKFVSCRTSTEAKELSGVSGIEEVAVVPCATTLLESEHYEIPGLVKNEQEKVVGIHLAPDILISCPNIIQIINEIPHKKVFIPFTHYNYDDSFMESLPLNKKDAIMLGKLNPLQLHSVISQMDYVIVSSLHATIFAYSQNVPFATMFQQKTYNYLLDRKLEEFVFQNETNLKKIIRKISTRPKDMTVLIEQDAKRVKSVFDNYARIIPPDNKQKISHPAKNINVKESELKLLLHQTELAVRKRDIIIHNMIYYYIRSNERDYKIFIDELYAKQAEIDRLKEVLESKRVKNLPKNIKRFLKNTGNKQV